MSAETNWTTEPTSRMKIFPFDHSRSVDEDELFDPYEMGCYIDSIAPFHANEQEMEDHEDESV